MIVKTTLLKTFLLTFVLCFVVSHLSAQTLTAHYKFDNTLNDETGNWDLSPSTGFTPTFETGQDGTENGAVSGFATADYLETASDFTISGNTSRSMTAWVKIATISGSQAIVGAGFPSNGERWSFLIDGQGRPRIEIAGQGFNNGPDAVEEDTWFHVAVVWDASVNTGGATGGEGIKLYLNGVLGNTNDWLDTDVMTAASRLRIGNDFNTNPPTDPPGRGFSGALDDIQIYEGALTDNQVLNIYNNGTLSVADVPDIEKLTAYPNPVQNNLYFTTNEVNSVDVFNVLGAKVLSQKVVNDGVDTSSLNKGIYFVNCVNNQGVKVKTIKIIKQ